MSKEQLSFEMEVGVLLCGSVRDFLQRRKFQGLNIEWHEGSGILSRIWIIKGDREDVIAINKELHMRLQ